MNKKKLSIVLVIISIILIISAIILIYINKKEDNNLNNNSSNKPETKYRNFECVINRDNNDNYSSLEKYIFDVDNRDKLLNLTNQYIYTYKNKELYNSTKNVSKEENVEFIDKEFKIIKSYKNDKITNSENVEVEILYNNFISSLGKKGFSCKEN